MSPPPRWSPGWLTIAIASAAGFLLGVVVLVIARGMGQDPRATSASFQPSQSIGLGTSNVSPEATRRPSK